MLDNPRPVTTSSPSRRLLVELADPKTAALSDRALGQRCGWHRLVVTGFRLALREAPPLSLCDCWKHASEEERRWFVDNVGLHRPLQFALNDQCAAFLRQLTDASRTQSLRHWFQQSLRVIR